MASTLKFDVQRRPIKFINNCANHVLIYEKKNDSEKLTKQLKRIKVKIKINKKYMSKNSYMISKKKKKSVNKSEHSKHPCRMPIFYSQVASVRDMTVMN